MRRKRNSRTHVVDQQVSPSVVDQHLQVPRRESRRQRDSSRRAKLSFLAAKDHFGAVCHQRQHWHDRVDHISNGERHVSGWHARQFVQHASQSTLQGRRQSVTSRTPVWVYHCTTTVRIRVRSRCQVKVRQHSTTGNHDTPPRAKRIEKVERLTCLSSATHAVTLSLRRAQSFSLVVVAPPREDLVLTSRIPHGGPPTLALLCLNLGTDGGDCGRHLATFRLARCCGLFQLHRAQPSTSSSPSCQQCTPSRWKRCRDSGRNSAPCDRSDPKHRRP